MENRLETDENGWEKDGKRMETDENELKEVKIYEKQKRKNGWKRMKMDENG